QDPERDPERAPHAVHRRRDRVADAVGPHPGEELRDAAEHRCERPQLAVRLHAAVDARQVERDHEGRRREAVQPEHRRSRERLQDDTRAGELVLPFRVPLDGDDTPSLVHRHQWVPFFFNRSLCGITVYRGSRADWNPALKTDQRSAASPASTRPLPTAVASRLRRPRQASSAAPAAAHPFDTRAYRPASPCVYTSPTKPSRRFISSITPSSTATPAIAARRAGPAAPSGVTSAAAAPPLAAALAPKSTGSSSRASDHTGIDVLAKSAPVYVASGGPVANDTSSARSFTGFSFPTRSSAAAVFDAPDETTRIQLP